MKLINFIRSLSFSWFDVNNFRTYFIRTFLTITNRVCKRRKMWMTRKTVKYKKTFKKTKKKFFLTVEQVIFVDFFHICFLYLSFIWTNLGFSTSAFWAEFNKTSFWWICRNWSIICNCWTYQILSWILRTHTYGKCVE